MLVIKILMFFTIQEFLDVNLSPSEKIEFKCSSLRKIIPTQVVNLQHSDVQNHFNDFYKGKIAAKNIIPLQRLNLK